MRFNNRVDHQEGKTEKGQGTAETILSKNGLTVDLRALNWLEKWGPERDQTGDFTWEPLEITRGITQNAGAILWEPSKEPSSAEHLA
ncbi:MAG: hypothetical protein RL215_386 [Planctomycetota bacterium]|jgi:hypothetical protein